VIVSRVFPLVSEVVYIVEGEFTNELAHGITSRVSYFRKSFMIENVVAVLGSYFIRIPILPPSIVVCIAEGITDLFISLISASFK